MALPVFAYASFIAMTNKSMLMPAHSVLQSALTAATLLAAAVAPAQAAENQTDKAAITALLETYEAALNASDTAAVLPLYAEDGVFMPPFHPSAIGQAALKQAYDGVFQAITLHVKFTVAEFVQMAPNWAFARTNSAGTNTINATGAQSAEANQELFLFRRGPDGSWKIARYAFSTTNPPPKS